MATSPIAATNVVNTAAASLRLDDLLRVLLTELTNQDPLKPVDNKDFMAQVAQFSTLDATQQLNQNIDRLVTLQAVSQSVGLIGKNVSAATDNGVINGKVVALSLVGASPTMSIDTGTQIVPNVAIGSLQTIRP